MKNIKLQKEEINQEPYTTTNPQAGACSIFYGIVRPDIINNLSISALEYTCYDLMALQQLELIADDAIKKYSLIELVIVHRLGIVKVNEIAIVVQVSSKHRKDSIFAIDYIMDLIKLKVPIWKKDLF
jgi:molybdopterin synthase catalytic subunit